jgi:hypothetical protein
MDTRGAESLAAQTYHRDVRNFAASVCARSASQCFAIANSSSNPVAMALYGALTEALRGSRASRQEIGDILNSLQGKQQNKHIQALLKLLTPKLAQFDSSFLDETQHDSVRTRTFVVREQRKERFTRGLGSAGLLRVLPQMMKMRKPRPNGRICCMVCRA